VADALASDRMIGMVLSRSEASGSEVPAVYTIGCSGVITHVEQLADGRYNIVLRGLERFRILEEDRTRSYRRAIVEPLPERELDPGDRARVRQQRDTLEAMLAAPGEPRGAEARTTAAMSDEDLVNALAQYLDLDPLERQALLERHCLRSRAESLVELLEMKILMARTPGASRAVH
jgi:Lon protease-like protein